MKENQSPTSTENAKAGVDNTRENLHDTVQEAGSLNEHKAENQNDIKEEASFEDRPTGKIKEIIIELDKQEQAKVEAEKRQNNKNKGTKGAKNGGLFAGFGSKKKNQEPENKGKPDSHDKRRYEEYMKKMQEGQSSIGSADNLDRTGVYQEVNTFYYQDQAAGKTAMSNKKSPGERRKKRTAETPEPRKKAKPSDTRSIRVKPGLNLFRIIELVVLVVLLVSVGFVGKYIWDYAHTNSLTVSDSKKNPGANAAFPRDINPFELFSSRKPDLIATFGDPISEGEDEFTQERYMNYEYEWFKSPAIARVFHGKEQRVYRIDVQFKTDSMDAMKEKMQKVLGDPWQIKERTEPKEGEQANQADLAPYVKWIKDSVSYKLSEGEDQKATLEMKLALYPNVNHLEVGANPTMIERHDGKDYTGDGQPDSIILLGDKTNFTDYYYTNLYILIWDGTQNIITKFPATMDGGVMPQMEVIPVEGAAPKLLITATNNAAKNYNIFQIQNNAFVNLYSSNDAPKDI